MVFEYFQDIDFFNVSFGMVGNQLKQLTHKKVLSIMFIYGKMIYDASKTD